MKLHLKANAQVINSHTDRVLASQCMNKAYQKSQCEHDLQLIIHVTNIL